jgi:histidinol-phosphate aminotransferase
MDISIDLTRRGWLAGSAAALVASGAGEAIAKPAQAAASSARLNLNESAFGPSPRAIAAIRAHALGLERYVGEDEVEALTARIAAFEQVRPEQVVIGEVLEPLGLYLASQRPGGGTFVYSDPGYTALIDSSAALGGKGVPVPLDGRLANDLPALARAVDARTLAVSLVNPHNPSGTVDDRVALDRFVEEISARTLVVADEAYLEYDDLPGRSAVRLLRQGMNVLVFRTLAKIYGLAGLSIGYALAPASVAEGLRRGGVGAAHSLNRLALVAAMAALEDQDHVRRVLDITIAERGRLVQTLDRLGLAHSDSRANFVFFRVPRAEDLRRHFAASGIAVGRAFPPLSDWVRITVGLPAENDRVIAALTAWAGA